MSRARRGSTPGAAPRSAPSKVRAASQAHLFQRRHKTPPTNAAARATAHPNPRSASPALPQANRTPGPSPPAADWNKPASLGRSSQRALFDTPDTDVMKMAERLDGAATDGRAGSTKKRNIRKSFSDPFEATRSVSAPAADGDELWQKMELKMSTLLQKVLACGAIFDSWSVWTTRQIYIKSLVAKASIIMQKRLLSKGWNGWRCFTHKMNRVRKMMLRMMHRKVVTAFLTWQIMHSRLHHHRDKQDFKATSEWTEAMMENRVLASAAQKMKNRFASKGMNAWIAFYKEKKRIRNTMNKVVARIKNMALAAALGGWMAMVAQKKATRNKLRKVVQRIRNMALSCCLLGWQATAHRAKHVRTIGNKAMLRIKNMAIAKGFSAMWALRCKMKRIRAMMLRWRHRLAMTVFTEWADTTAFEIGERKRLAELAMFRSDLEMAQEVMNKRIIASVAQKMKNRDKAKALNSWRGFVKEKVRIRNLCNKVIKRIQNGLLAAALLGWSSFVKRKRHIRYIGNKCIQRIKNIAITKAFNAMLHLARKMKRVRAMMTRWRHRQLATVFNEWADCAAFEIASQLQSGTSAELESKNASLLAAQEEIERLQATIAEFNVRIGSMTQLPAFVTAQVSRRPAAQAKMRSPSPRTLTLSPGSARSRGSPASASRP